MYTMNMVPTSPPQSPWHSPVPYLFGGLAAMLGLIAFALLILACSYWKLSGYLENDADRDLEAGEGHKSDEKPKFTMHYVENIVVIMAGQENPTYLATPVSSRASSHMTNFSGDEVVFTVEGDGEKMDEGKLENRERPDTSI